MKIKSFLARPYAAIVSKQVRKSAATAISDQERVLQDLLKGARSTVFAADHNLRDVSDYDSFRHAVPVRDYEAFRPYIDQIKDGKQNVLWKGRPIYFAKTSGTTS